MDKPQAVVKVMDIVTEMDSAQKRMLIEELVRFAPIDFLTHMIDKHRKNVVIAPRQCYNVSKITTERILMSIESDKKMYNFDELAKIVWSKKTLNEKKTACRVMIDSFKHKENQGRFYRDIDACTSSIKLDAMAADLMQLQAGNRVSKW